MAAEQTLTQAVMQIAIEVAKAAIMSVREADNLFNNARPIHSTPRLGGSVLRQPTFDWEAIDKYHDLCIFEI